MRTWTPVRRFIVFLLMAFSPEKEIGMGCKEKNSCGGMKMRNESQVGFNQNYQLKKNDNFEKNECTWKEKMMVQAKK